MNQTRYRSLVGTLMCLATRRPDLTYLVSIVSCFMKYSPRDVHWEIGNFFLKYVKGTIDHGWQVYNAENWSLVDHSNSDWAGSVDDCKHTFSYAFSIGASAISWSSEKQYVVALSTAEVEYVALASTGCQDI